MRDDFLSRVTHDLRTPVAVLSWSLRNMLDGLTGEMNPRQQEYLAAMVKAVRDLEVMVAGILEDDLTGKPRTGGIPGEADHGPEAG